MLHAINATTSDMKMSTPLVFNRVMMENGDGKWVESSKKSYHLDIILERPFDFITTSKTWNDDFYDIKSDGVELVIF